MTTQQKTAPVQGWPAGIPWSLHLEAYAVYSKKYGPQPALIDLEGRGCRGGFGTRELDDFIPGWRERASEIAMLRQEVERLEAANAELLESLKVCEKTIDRLWVSHHANAADHALDLSRAAIKKYGGAA